MLSSPIAISLKTSIIATCITFFLGVFAARFVLKLKRLRGVVDGLFTLPMVLPPTVVGFFLLLTFGTNGPLKSIYSKLGFQIVFSYSATVITATIVSFPLMYRIALGAFEQVNNEYVEAARTLGLKEGKIFYKIILPIARPGLVSGIILSFARALGEFGATIMLAGNIPGKTQTISTAIYSAVQAGNRPLAFRWSLVVVGLSFLSMISVNIFGSKNRGFL
ncbi:MAG: molybdate ABC transporter permease subunit [Tissierellia bacterium]|nr:molybdate ABC transporter permease subunit [Tissierellia bacterium]